MTGWAVVSPAGQDLHKEWLRSFKQAIADQHVTALIALADQSDQTPVLLVSSQPDPVARSVLGWAIRERSAWGVEHLLAADRSLAQGVVGLEELDSFFETLALFNEQRHEQECREMVGEVWPLLLPAVEASSYLRLYAVGAFLKHFPSRLEVARRQWEDLGMRAVSQGVVDTPFYPMGQGLLTTALQLAWLNALPAAVELLLDAGASAVRSQPSTVLPNWDLASATAVRDQVCAEGLSTRQIQVHAQQRWATASPSVYATLGDALVSICDFRSKWQGVDQRVRAQVLDHALPSSPSKTRVPRF